MRKSAADDTAGAMAHGHRIAATLLLQTLGFRDVAREVTEVLMAAGHVRHLGKGETLVHRGQPFDFLCVVIQGSLEAGVILEDGRRFLVSFLSPGDVAGLMSLMDGMPHPNDLLAREAHTCVLLVPGESYRRLRDHHASLARAVELQLSYRSRLLYERLISDAAMPLEMRLARQLHLMAVLSGRTHGRTEQPAFRMSQTDMGDFLGVSRPRANFAAQQLKKEGLIELRYSMVTIVDPAALALKAGFR